jgi:hypothetical protein
MTLLNEIRNCNPVLIVYPAGTGGEHIAHTLSSCSDEFEILKTNYVSSVNQHHTICVLKYSTHINDLDDFDSALDERYTGNFSKTNKRIVLKDHPTNTTLEFYSEYLKDALVFLVYPLENAQYFAELTFKKLGVKVYSPMDQTYIRSQISTSLTKEEESYIIGQVGQYEWVWRHEIHNMISLMKDTNSFVKIQHHDTLDTIVEEHKHSIINSLDNMVPKFQSAMPFSHVINCDCLIKESTDFWKQIQTHIKSLDVDKATTMTNLWIKNNNKLEN